MKKLSSTILFFLVIVISAVISWAGKLENAQERVRNNPNDAYAQFYLGVAFVNSGQHQKAIVPYKEAIRIKPDYADAHNNLSQIYFKLRRYQDAVASVKEAIRIQPDHVNSRIGLGMTYLELGQHQEAIDSLNEALRIKPDHANTHLALGFAYKKLGKYEDAITEYKEALRIRPDFPQARNQLSELEQKPLAERLAEEKLAREKLLLEEERKNLEALRLAEENNKKVAQEYTKLIEIEKKPEESVPADSKVKAWEEFLGKHKGSKPYAEKASKRLKYWNQLARLSPDERNLIPSMNMVLVSSGCFMMGASNNFFNENEQPVHEVCLSSFHIDIYEVTQAEYEEVTGKNPSFFVGSDLPVEEVTWDDANNYCVAVNKRLPTEAEWEYAARHKATHKYYWGEELGTANANCSGCGSEWDNVKTAVVGSFKPNSLGIYDMAGNVWEWVSDWYDAGYYATSPKQDPKGPPSGKAKSLRGGSWASIPNTLRITNRFRSYPDNKRNYRGFRCAK
ncbi:MAG TPA: formylglycine-generating enzyme family protein [Nitrospina sp.]|nr:formylglycine-generating enzyme family protein [Nitrospina sp.]